MQAQPTPASEFHSSIDLARRLHDTIAQRLTGLSCFLGDPGGPVPDGALETCRAEIHAAIDELQEALDSVGRSRPAHARLLEAEVAALRSVHPDVELDWRWMQDAADEAGSLMDSFLIESLCNVRKHSRPTQVVVESRQVHGATIVSVTNDGVSTQPGRGTRQGSRLLALEATAHGAITESHAERSGHWRQQLIMPSFPVGLSA